MHDVRTDAELLNTMLDDAGFVYDRHIGQPVAMTVKTLSAWTGYSVQTISCYKNGERNIPIGFWRSILEHHYDSRILRLLVPPTHQFEVYPVNCNIPASPPEFFREAVKVEGEHHETMSHLANMLADGQLDDLDAETLQKYADSFDRHRTREADLHRALIATFNRRVEQKAALRRPQ